MGHINFPLRDFYDGASELVALKSGILLNRFKVSEFLREKFSEEFLMSDNLQQFIRIGSDTMTEMVIHLRRRIGNLPEHLQVMDDYMILREHMIKTKDMLASGLGGVAFQYLNKIGTENLNRINELLKKNYKIDDKVSSAALNIGLYMLDTDITVSTSQVWDDAVSLNSLFEMETKPKASTEFIEQKFIDYLATNGHEIEIIHWRNFERFCAEYFRRQGYHAVLGPGSNDGGVDIRVYPTNEEQADSFIMIQCKRYSSDHKVTIETVKSFYTDVLFEGAKEGIIATTGHIASGGKKVVEARKYNISFKEKENIKKWAIDMQSHKTTPQ